MSQDPDVTAGHSAIFPASGLGCSRSYPIPSSHWHSGSKFTISVEIRDPRGCKKSPSTRLRTFMEYYTYLEGARKALLMVQKLGPGVEPVKRLRGGASPPLIPVISTRLMRL